MDAREKSCPELRLALLALLGLSAMAYLGKGYEVTLRGIDSNIHAAVSMGVTSGGAAPVLPIPYALGPGGVFNDHPFTFFWVNGWLMRWLGVTAWSARLLTAAFGVGSVWMTYLIGRRLHSAWYGVAAALVFALSRDFVLTAGTVSLDTALVFFILLSFWFWIGGRWIGAAIAAGIGLWFKTPIVLLVYPTAFIELTLERRLRAELPRLLGALGLSIALGALFWLLAGILGGSFVPRDYWLRQLWGTAVGGRGAPDYQWDYFFRIVPKGFLPGLPFLIWAIARVSWRKQWSTPRLRIPLIASAIIAIAVTLMRFKLGHYFVPIFPFLALLSAEAVTDWLAPRVEKFYRALVALVLAIAVFLVITPVPLAPEAFVALRKFEPFIQTHGTCSDRIVLVDGGQPIGSVLDEALHLSFYTGRKIEDETCETLAVRVARDAPEWIILSAENSRKCLSARLRGRFPSSLQVGNIVLLSRVMTLKQASDLTPLLLDGRAVVDCRVPPYPRDLWHRYDE